MNLKNRAYLIFIAVVALAGVVLLNGIASILAGRNDVRFDLTEGGLFTLSEETHSFLSELQNNIDIFILGAEAGWQDDLYHRRIAEVLRGYEAASGGRVKVEYRDPGSEPDVEVLFSDHPGLLGHISHLYRNDIVIRGPHRTARISPAELYEYEYNGGHTEIVPIRLNAEGPLLAELHHVLAPTAGNVYFLRSSAEMNDYAQTLMNHMINLGFLCQPLNLREEDIPEDADVLVSMAPREDYHPQDIDAINTFLDAGGFFMLFYLQDGEARTHLDRFLAGWGVSAPSPGDDGILTGPPAETGDGHLFVALSSLADDNHGMSAQNAPDNLSFFTALLRQFAPGSGQLPVIPAKPLLPEPLQLSAGQDLAILALLVFILPILILIPGLLYVHKRKQRR